MNSNDCYKFVQINDDALSFINYIVDKYGDVLVVGSNKPLEASVPDYHHDYFYFCLTKATRSLLASNRLAEMRFREDAMVLARAAYETYLLIANVIDNEHFIQKSVINSLLLRTGQATYLRRKDGTINYRKVVIDNKTFDYDISISTLSKKTYCEYDKFIHKELYKYMSEFMHSDYIGSGNYRTNNDKSYDVEPKKLYLDIHFLIMYITYLLIQSMYLEFNRYKLYPFNQLEKDEMSELGTILHKLSNCLKTILNELDFSLMSYDVHDMIYKRISENII